MRFASLTVGTCNDELRFALGPGVQLVRFALGKEASLRDIDEFAFHPADQRPTGFNQLTLTPIEIAFISIGSKPRSTSEPTPDLLATPKSLGGIQPLRSCKTHVR